MYHIFFIQSSVSGSLGSVHVLAIVNSAAVNIGVHISFQIMVFSGYMPRSGILESQISKTNLVTKGWGFGAGINQVFGINTYTLLTHVKQIISEDLCIAQGIVLNIL